MIKSEFEKLLNGYLTLAKINRVELAQELGMSKSSLSNKLAGIRKFSAAELHRLVIFFVENRALTKFEQLEQLVVLGGLSLAQVFVESEWHQEPLSRFLRDVKKANDARNKKNTNLDASLTDIFGREYQLDILTNLIKTKVRLLTITGPGGVGKTRLSLALAWSLVDQFRDGVWWVNLASIRDSMLMVSAISKTLGLSQRPNQELIETLKENLADKQLLLVLDNFEQLVAQGACEIVSNLMAANPNLKILVTSRILLRVYGEYEFVLTSLASPGTANLPSLEVLSEYPAIKLFIERAQAVNNEFSLTQNNAQILAKICERLEGLPLSIEIAAARTKMFTLSQMLTLLVKRFEFLKADDTVYLERHRSLDAAISWSYNLLMPGEQELFLRLSVFDDNFTLEAARFLCDTQLQEQETFRQVQKLVNESLVKIIRTEDEIRFGFLESIREYAQEKLKEAGLYDRVRSREAEFYLDLAT